MALLAAAEVLGNASAATNYTRRLVFAALAGEPWGLMGSRRLLWQMHAGHASTRGLSLIDIEQVRHAFCLADVTDKLARHSPCACAASLRLQLGHIVVV